MSHPVSSQTRLLDAGTAHSTLRDWMEINQVQHSIPNETRTATTAGAGDQFVLLDSSMQAGNIFVDGSDATWTTTVTTPWYFASDGATIGTASVAFVDTDTYGNYLNLVPIRIAGSHDKILTADDFEIFGLVQTDGADGAAIGAAASENLQMSFAYVDASGTLTLAALDATATVTIEFGMRPVLRHANLPSIYSFADNGERPTVTSAGNEPTVNTAIWTVTAQYAAGEDITLSTFAGATAGTATQNGGVLEGIDTVTTLGASATIFNALDDKLLIYRNGILQDKGQDVIWRSATTFDFQEILYVGEEIRIVETIYP